MEKKILVVDDDLSVRELVYEALVKQGYKVITATGAKAALELFSSQRPDLTFLDFKLPDSSGLEVLKKIKELNKRAKVIMLTGLGTDELEKEARLAGAGGFLRKNLGIDVIVKVVGDILGVKRQYKQNNILVVDDDTSVSSLIKDFLEKKGYKVSIAGSGEEGLELFKKHNPIVVLLDVKLPGMDGITTLKRIRQMSKEVGVIMITGLKDQGVFEDAKKLGAHEYIIKPFDLNYLETCLLVRIFLVSAITE